MNQRSMRIKYVAVSAMLCALGVILLGVGAAVEVLDLSTAVLASLLCIYAVIEIRGIYPWLIWLGTSILALLLLPLKTPALFYALFAGFYPILKEKLERLPRIPGYLLKLLVFHLSLGGIVLVLKFFLPEALESYGMTWMPWVLYGLCLLCFVIYDIALTRLITLYLLRFRRYFRIR
ncbi:MAG: hypothetical protein IJX28_03120 [Clostridia bacterium]|nr:hypothetical protein [Clostridia bacterium]